jgi:homoaconitate hydratase
MTPRRAAFGSFSIHELAIKRAVRRQTSGCGRHTIQPYSSVSPKPEQQRPQRQLPFRLTQWQRNFAFGVLVGGLGFAAYVHFSNKQSRDAFIPYKLVEKVPVSSTASVFVLEAPDNSHNSQNPDKYREAWQKGIWNVHFKQPQLQIVRPYTPVPFQDTSSKDGVSRLRFLIRNDVQGEVSSYLHRLPTGSVIELRGPNLEYEISPNAKQIVFFAGGTGIAPALQVAHALFNSKESGKEKKLHILWANRKREDCVGGHSDYAPPEPLTLKSKISSMFAAPQSGPHAISPGDQGLVVKELEQLKQKHPGQVTVEYFVNQENTWINTEAVFKALSRFDDTAFSQGSSSPQEERQILISGPNGFISYLAGPKEWLGGKEQQGGVSKILAHALAMNPHNVKVWKV